MADQPALVPTGFRPDIEDPSRAFNSATGQNAVWDADKQAWTDTATGAALARAESISAAPPSDDAPAGPGDHCAGRRRTAAFLDGMHRAYSEDHAHADAVIESEVANASDIARNVQRLLGEMGPSGSVIAAGAATQLNTPLVGLLANSVPEAIGGGLIALPLLGLAVGTTAGLIVREMWNQADLHKEFADALGKLEAVRGRLAFFAEHSATLAAAEAESAARLAAATAALNACEASSPKDPCAPQRVSAGQADGHLEGLRRMLAAVQTVLSGAAETLARVGAALAAGGLSEDQNAVQRSTSAYEGGKVKAAQRESDRLEGLLRDAAQAQTTARKAVKDCDEHRVSDRRTTPGRNPRTWWWALALIAAVVAAIVGAVGLGIGRTPTGVQTGAGAGSPTPSSSSGAPTSAPLAGGNGSPYYWTFTGYADSTDGCADYSGNPNVATGPDHTHLFVGYMSLANGVLHSGNAVGVLRADGAFHLDFPADGPETIRTIDGRLGATQTTGAGSSTPLTGTLTAPYPNGTSSCLVRFVSTSGQIDSGVAGFGGH